MGDTAHGQVIVWSCPTDQAHLVLEVLDRYRLRGGSEDPTAPVRLLLGTAYRNPAARVALVHGVLADLAEQAPGAVFEVAQDGVHENPGEIAYYTPARGGFHALRLDQEVGPVFTAAEITRAMAEAGDLDALHAWVDRHTGGPWHRAIDSARPGTPRGLAPLPACGHCGDRVAAPDEATTTEGSVHLAAGTRACPNPPPTVAAPDLTPQASSEAAAHGELPDPQGARPGVPR